MSREDLMKKTKDYIITLFLKSEESNKTLKNEIEYLSKELEIRKVDEYLHREYLTMIERVKFLEDLNNGNEFKITELQQLLDRYKNIVDKLGGSKYE